MKKLFLLLFVGAMVIVSCSKDDDDTNYAQDDIIGAWVVTSTPYDDDDSDDSSICDDYENVYTFTSDSLRISTYCSGTEYGYTTVAYAYSANTISYTFLVDNELEITSLSDSKMTCKYSAAGYSIGKYTFEKKD